jgi:hypothetical protein
MWNSNDVTFVENRTSMHLVQAAYELNVLIARTASREDTTFILALNFKVLQLALMIIKH